MNFRPQSGDQFDRNGVIRDEYLFDRTGNIQSVAKPLKGEQSFGSLIVCELVFQPKALKFLGIDHAGHH